MERSRLQPDDLLKLTTGLARMLLKKGFDKQKINLLLIFIKHYAHFGRPEEFIKFEVETEKDIINQKLHTMGIEEIVLQMARDEGEERGIEKGQREKEVAVISNLLTQTDFPVQKIAELAGSTVDFVIHVRNML